MPIPYDEIRKLIDDTAFQRRLQVALWRGLEDHSPDPGARTRSWSPGARAAHGPRAKPSSRRRFASRPPARSTIKARRSPT